MAYSKAALWYAIRSRSKPAGAYSKIKRRTGRSGAGAKSPEAVEAPGIAVAGRLPAPPLASVPVEPFGDPPIGPAVAPLTSLLDEAAVRRALIRT